MVFSPLLVLAICSFPAPAVLQVGVDAALQKDINQSIQKGVEFLMGRQLADGSWDGWSHQYAGGVTPLCLYALLKSIVPPHHPSILRGLENMRARPPAHTYNTAFLLLAVASAKQEKDLPWAEELAATLADWQRKSGLWGYPDAHEDLSNTLIAVMALDAASEMGVAVPGKFWKTILAAAEVSLAPERGFTYTPGGAASGSMVAAGITITQIARKHLGKRINSRQQKRIDEINAAALDWLAEHWTFNKNPPNRAWSYFHIWGYERVGAWLRTETIGEHQWYPEGARALINAQQKAGNRYGFLDPNKYDLGRDGTAELRTCMALLFLNRASSRSVTAGGTSYVPLATPDHEEVVLTSTGDTPMTLFVSKSDLPGTSGKFYARKQGESRWRLIGEDESADQGIAVRHSFDSPGIWEVRCEIETEGGTLKSSVLKTRVSMVMPAGALDAASDVARNRWKHMSKEVSQSSFLDHRTGENSFDGLLGRAWVCQANDAHPWVEVKIRSRLRASNLLLTHAFNRSAGAHQPLAKNLRVTLNGDDPIEVAMGSEPWQKTKIPLGRNRLVRTLKIEILDLHNGSLGRASTGFSEIEVQ